MRPYDFSNIEMINTHIKQALNKVDQREKSFDTHRKRVQSKIFNVIYRAKLNEGGFGQSGKPKVYK